MGLPVTPALRLDGQRALVTGAGRGIGRAAAAALSAAGAHVTLTARTAQDIMSFAGEIGAMGAGVATKTIDVTDIASMSAWIEGEAPFDILVNNAGTNRPMPFVAVAPEDFDAVLDINLRAAFFVAQSVARRLIGAGKPGSIINMSSQMGHVGSPNRTIYCASKHALEGLTKAMAVELGGHGIRVNSLCPTFVETPLTEPYLADPAFRSKALSKIAVGRFGVPEDIMGAILFLASPASALMTGSALMLDGGWTAE